MDRVQNIPESISSAEELARYVETALEEVHSIAKRAIVQSAASVNPESGELKYDDATDTLYIYNKTDGEFKPH